MLPARSAAMHTPRSTHHGRLLEKGTGVRIMTQKGIHASLEWQLQVRPTERNDCHQ